MIETKKLILKSLFLFKGLKMNTHRALYKYLVWLWNSLPCHLKRYPSWTNCADIIWNVKFQEHVDQCFVWLCVQAQETAQLEEQLQGWGEVILAGDRVLRWEKAWFPGALMGATTMLFMWVHFYCVADLHIVGIAHISFLSAVRYICNETKVRRIHTIWAALRWFKIYFTGGWNCLKTLWFWRSILNFSRFFFLSTKPVEGNNVYYTRLDLVKWAYLVTFFCLCFLSNIVGEENQSRTLTDNTIHSSVMFPKWHTLSLNLWFTVSLRFLTWHLQNTCA